MRELHHVGLIRSREPDLDVHGRAAFLLPQLDSVGEALDDAQPVHAVIQTVCTAEQIGLRVVDALEKIPLRLHGMQQPRSDKPSSFSCPDCGGVLWELQENGVLHYRCRTGHSYSPSGLFVLQDGALEEALWTAIRALEERAEMSEVLAKRLHGRNLQRAAERLERQARLARERAELVRKTVTDLLVRQEAVEANEFSAGA